MPVDVVWLHIPGVDSVVNKGAVFVVVMGLGPSLIPMSVLLTDRYICTGNTKWSEIVSEVPSMLLLGCQRI